MAVNILHGDIIFAPSPDSFDVHENSYLVTENGKVEGIYEKLPEKYSGVTVEDREWNLIIPAFSDLHVHASQYVQRGVGMDMLLADWLNHYTFPQEVHFSDPEYTKLCYDAFTADLIKNGTFHVNAFTTIHRESADYLFEAHDKNGLRAFVGKVRPILIPRFAPAFSEPLMTGLGKLAAKYHVGVQLSKLKEFYEPDYQATIKLSQAFFHATKEGGSVFGNVGSPEKGYVLDALVIENMEDPWKPLSAEDRLERFCYNGDDRNTHRVWEQSIHFIDLPEWKFCRNYNCSK